MAATSSSLEYKTIRPGSLGAYSYYHSNRLPPRPNAVNPPRAKPLPWRKAFTVLVVSGLIFGVFSVFSGSPDTKPKTSLAKSASPVPVEAAPVVGAAAVSPKAANPCAANTLDHLMLISVSQRHLWACEQVKAVHDAPVITGMLAHASTLTPTGTYKVYAKIINTTLTGKDETGSWRDPVTYWMPFLDNQHGTYGFHDATWRADQDFGKTDPTSPSASHGCVELPLASSKWLYDWAPVGTTVTVES